MLFPYGVWNFFHVPTRKLLKQQNLPSFLRHCCSDSICNSHLGRTDLRIESKAVKIILKKCFRILDFIRAIIEAPLHLQIHPTRILGCKHVYHQNIGQDLLTLQIKLQKFTDFIGVFEIRMESQVIFQSSVDVIWWNFLIFAYPKSKTWMVPWKLDSVSCTQQEKIMIQGTIQI